VTQPVSQFITAESPSSFQVTRKIAYQKRLARSHRFDASGRIVALHIDDSVDKHEGITCGKNFRISTISAVSNSSFSDIQSGLYGPLDLQRLLPTLTARKPMKPLASHMTKPFVTFAGIHLLLCGRVLPRLNHVVVSKIAPHFVFRRCFSKSRLSP
jgi:hypothetical protein